MVERRSRQMTINILKRMAEGYEEDAKRHESDTCLNAVFTATANAYRRAAEMIESEME